MCWRPAGNNDKGIFTCDCYFIKQFENKNPYIYTSDWLIIGSKSWLVEMHQDSSKNLAIHFMNGVQPSAAISFFYINPISGTAFSVIRQAQGGGGGLRGPDAKNQG